MSNKLKKDEVETPRKVNTPEEEKKRMLITGFVVIGIMLLIAIVIVIAVVMKNPSSSTSTTTDTTTESTDTSSDSSDATVDTTDASDATADETSDATTEAEPALNTTAGTVCEEGDTVAIDYVGTKDGVAFDGGTGSYDLTLGSGQFIDGFESGLVGHTVSETVELTLTFPENYGSEELAGPDVVFTVTINGVYE